MAEKLEFLIEDLVAANRILSHEDIVDAYGHVSVRHPDNPNRFLLSRARAPECIEASDIMEFTLEGEAVDPRARSPYLERFIHGAIFEARPEIHSVVHNHSHNVIPYGITGTKMRPVMHSCASIGHEVPIWDTQPNSATLICWFRTWRWGETWRASWATVRRRSCGAMAVSSAAASIRRGRQHRLSI